MSALLLVVSILLLVGGVLVGATALVALGGAAAVVSDVLLHRRTAARLPRHLDLLRAEHAVRGVLVQCVVVFHLLTSDELPRAAELAVLTCVVAHQVLWTACRALLLLDARLRTRRAEVRNLPGGAGPLPARSPLVGEAGLAWVSGAAALLPLSLAGTLLGPPTAASVGAAAVMVLVAVVVVALVGARVVPLLRHPRGQPLVAAAHRAVVAYEPSVLAYLSGGPHDLHCLHGWLSTLEALQRRVLIVLREPASLERLRPTPLPVVCLPEPPDVRSFRIPTARVALFVANAPGNLDLLRDPSLVSVHIGHGDSDKASSTNPANKMYDEIWVAGPAAERRKQGAGRPVRIVGRPQVRAVRPAGPADPQGLFRVLYAPTWEGLYADPFESSLVHSGLEVVRVLLSLERVAVVYRPHPTTGFRDPAFSRAHAQIVQALADAGAPHRVETPAERDLYTCFNEVDAMVADISGVVTDFLASDKPYFVVDGRGLPEEEFRRQNPSAAGAYLVGPAAAGLAAGVAAARGPDPLRARRRAVRLDLLGPADEDPLATFERALDEVAGDVVTVADGSGSPAGRPGSAHGQELLQ